MSSCLSEEEQDEWYDLIDKAEGQHYTWMFLAQYWMDGYRSVLDIADLIEIETGQHPLDFLTRYIEFLKIMNQIEVKTK